MFLHMNAHLEMVTYACCVFTGYYLGSKNLLSESFWHVLLKALLWVVYPGLIFHSITKGYSKGTLQSQLFLPAAGFGIMLVGFILGHAYLRLQKKVPSHKRATLGALATMGNHVFLPYPIAKLIWDDQAGNAVILTSLGGDIGVWTLGISFLVHRGNKSLKRLINPPLIAMLCAIAIVLLEIRLPEFIMEIKIGFGSLGSLAVPLAMLFLGYNLKGTQLSSTGLAEFAPTMLIQLILIPIVTWIICQLLSVPQDSAKVLYLVSAMPSAIACVMLSQLYHGDAALAAKGVLVSHIGAFLTVPVFLYTAMY